MDIGLQIGSALSSAHKEKIIHRDLKSDNIIITEKNKAIIIDFGLAKLVDQARITKEGLISGTVVYAGTNTHVNSLNWLEKAFEQKDGILVYLNVILIFAEFCSNRKFINILNQMGLGA